MAKQYDAIIIGTGILGACIGFEMAKKGYKTLNVDKLAAAGYGSTSATCAIIRFYYSTRDGCAFAWENYFYWNDWAGYVGDYDPRGLAKFIKCGTLSLNRPGSDHSKQLQIFDELGVEYEHWTFDQVKERFPIFNDECYWPVRRPDDEGFGQPNGEKITTGLRIPQAGYISDPQLSVHNVQMAAEAVGGEFIFNAEVVEILKKDGRAAGVRLKDGTELEAKVVVNAAGPHSFIINRLAGVEEGMNIKTRALRHEVVHVPAPEGFDFEKIGCVISDRDIGGYYRPEVGNHILSGSEDPECDERIWPENPDEFNRNLTEQARVQALRVAQRIQTLPIPNKLQGVVDLYDVADDWIPIYDKSDLPGFYMAVGTSGNQYKNGPVVGKMMTQLIEEVEAGRDHDADPIVYHLENCGYDLNMKFFSRLREINEESSFSVLG